MFWLQKKMSCFHSDTSAQAIVEYVLIVAVILFGTLAVVEGVELPFEIDGDVVKISGFKDALNTYLKQIYNLLHIMIP